jgi:hypothetical protein
LQDNTAIDADVGGSPTCAVRGLNLVRRKPAIAASLGLTQLCVGPAAAADGILICVVDGAARAKPGNSSIGKFVHTEHD